MQQQQQQQQQPLSLKTFQSSSTQLAKIEEKIQGRGMCRSSASYGIQQMLQDQVQLIPIYVTLEENTPPHNDNFDLVYLTVFDSET